MNPPCAFTCRANLGEGRASRWGQGRGERQVSENDGDRCGGDKKANKPLSHPRPLSQHSVHQNYAEEPGQTLEVAVYLSAVLWVPTRIMTARVAHRCRFHKPAQKIQKYRAATLYWPTSFGLSQQHTFWKKRASVSWRRLGAEVDRNTNARVFKKKQNKQTQKIYKSCCCRRENTLFAKDDCGSFIDINIWMDVHLMNRVWLGYLKSSFLNGRGHCLWELLQRVGILLKSCLDFALSW